MTEGERIGVFGGTFDPFHNGHLDVALAAANALRLDRVLVVPTRVPPHRVTHPHASTWHRFAMAALAADSDSRLVACDIELQSSEPSYTAATLDRLHQAATPSSQLFFITGADAFAEIETWRDYPALLDRCPFVAVSRPSHPAAALRERLPALASRMIVLRDEAGAHARHRLEEPGGARVPVFLIDARTSDVSSTDVRRRLAAGESVSGLVPPAIARHIQKIGLYAPVHAGGKPVA
jgi:nicotinate-nucleotide adenylyltransferase